MMKIVNEKKKQLNINELHSLDAAQSWQKEFNSQEERKDDIVGKICLFVCIEPNLWSHLEKKWPNKYII